MMQTRESEDLAKLIGKKIVKADSSLKNFSVVLDDRDGLRIDAVDGADGPVVGATVVPADQLPVAKEAVCAVDWSWIYNSTIKSIDYDSSRVKLQLEPAGPLTILVSTWQGSGFLGFQPFKPNK
ncbi:MAG TPA: hypothetical protein V6C72_06345 [Chroococcales cyanobacterium]